MAFTAADIPGRIDVLIDGNGYVFDDTLDTSTVYSTRQRMQAGLTPTFIQRQNVSGDFGDNQQDFFVTFTQRDWSEGEQSRFFRQADADSVRRYWQGASVDVRTPGAVSLGYASSSLTFSAAIITVAPSPESNKLIALSATKLFTVDSSGTIVDKGVHSLAASPQRFAVATDGVKVYFSDGGGGNVRSWDGGSFATFSATSATALAFLNNTLYGLGLTGSPAKANTLIRYDTAGSATTIYSWKNADGTNEDSTPTQLMPFGGKLAILRIPLYRPGELWIYDGGVAPSLLGRLPSGIAVDQMEEVLGIIFISGTLNDRPIIMYYANGTWGTLWRGATAGGNIIAPSLASFWGGLLFTNSQTSHIMFYELATGSISSVGTYTAAGSAPMLGATNASAAGFALEVHNATTGWLFPTSSRATSATLTTSLVDFDSSLPKNFHGVRVEFDSATDGDGGSVDVAYRIGDVDGSYTSLLVGATSGTEIAFSSVSGRSISIKVTLNKGTSTNGPVLKRISVRGAAQEPTYFNCFYTLACYGTDRASPPTRQPLRDGTHHDKSGLQMVADLRTSAAKPTPIQITDEVNGTYTGYIMPETVNIDRMRPGEFRVQFTARSI